MTILILGAGGSISHMLIEFLLKQTDHKLVLYGRNVSRRLTVTNKKGLK
jgi:FlaA1/EpsC-like NDP-sugar epimerase